MWNKDDKESIEFVEVGAGEHICQLTNIKGIGRTQEDIIKAFRWKNGIKTDEQYDVIRLVFKVAGKENAYICKTVPATTSDRGNLFKTIQYMTEAWRKIQFSTKGYAEPGDFMVVLEKLRDARGFYKVTKALNQYDRLVVTKIEPTDEIPFAQPEPVEQAPVHTDEDITFDEDEIPF